MTRSLRRRPGDGTVADPATKQGIADAIYEPEDSGWEELPHNLGRVRNSTSQVKMEPVDDPVAKAKNKEINGVKEEPKLKVESPIRETDLPQAIDIATQRTLRPRRKKTQMSYAESEDEFVNLEAPRSSVKRLPTKKRSIKKEKDDEDTGFSGEPAPPRKRAKKTKDNPYGLTPGITPFPEWMAPSATACKEVYKRLAKLHGQVRPPTMIQAPSLEVSGCGEVPSVIDALIRTRLSAHTSASNSNAAFKGLVTKFGVVKSGIGKGSVDWDKVRTAPVESIAAAIKHGGLAQVKSRDIKGILELVHKENMMRRDAFLAEKKTGQTADVVGAKDKAQGQKDLEILKTDQGLLSLDHIHGMHPDEAMQALVKFPGIGVKTASCVIMFCLQQPSFAVDTHVHRLSGWLEWMPPKASRDETFSHLEVRIPSDLKYGLHKLFVQHGRSCVRCRANTTEGTEEWNETECPIEDLVHRVGKRKMKGT